VQKLLLQTFGWILAHAPEPLLHGISILLGELIFLIPRRRRVALSNLHHVFPERSPEWRRRIARESSRRLVETALLSLATPYLSEDRLFGMVTPSARLTDLIYRHQRNPEAVVMVTPHMAYWEIQTCMPHMLPKPYPEMGVIYRPLDNAAADEWVKRARERFGLKMLSRREGFLAAMKILGRRGVATVLFDQNAGNQGALTTLFGRVCSTTELAGLMVSRYSACLEAIYARRLAFWRVELLIDEVRHDNTVEGATIALNRWLEEKLLGDENLCASWLWAHDRWRNQDVPARRFRLEAKRNFLAADVRIRGLAALPRRTRVYVRLPNWLGDVVMALPLLRALREGRPDAEVTLVGKPQFRALLERWKIADRYETLPPAGRGYFAHFRGLRAAYPDVWVLFTNSARGDIEAWLARSPQRFGIVRRGKRRPLLTHAYHVPGDFDERAHHQLELWEAFVRHFGLQAPVDRSPVLPAPLAGAGIGLIAGSENNPEKRWPVGHWRELIAAFPQEKFTLFGTANDQAITREIASDFGDRVEDLAGRTSLPEYAERLRACRLLVTNDTGGMHLANALGVPLIALFGPTNPVRTRPVFSAPVTILQPPGCPPTGGAALAMLRPETVIATVQQAGAVAAALN
jgi:ADP-heptose:LPS heptosyltransferase/lauroyl/myristoyl acyltransferase